MPFKIPTEQEVADYIKTKKNWPDDFCKYYAERFYNFYQSNGWKVSGKAPMKDWKAAFNSQWQNLKFKEDIETLQKMNEKKKPQTTNEGYIDRLHDFMTKYQQHPTSIPFQDFGKWYEFMKSENLLAEFSKEEKLKIFSIYNRDTEKCKCWAVQATFDTYANTGMSVKDIVTIRQRL